MSNRKKKQKRDFYFIFLFTLLILKFYTMKKLKSLKLMLLAVVALFGMNASAESLLTKTIFKAPFKYTIETVNGDDGTGTVSVEKNDADELTSLTIPETFTETVEGTEFTGTMTFTVVEIKENGFAGLPSLTSVSLPKSIKTIGAHAFSGDYALSTLTLADGIALDEIGNEAFNSWISSTFDLSKATKLKDLPEHLLTTDAARTGAGNMYITEVVLPTSIETPSTALAYLPNLATLNIASTKTKTVAANFLTGNTKITSLTLPSTVEAITAGALAGSAVTSLTINSFKDAGKPAIGAFGKALESVTVNNEFKGVFNAAGDVKSLTFAGKFSGTVKADAFTEVESVTFGEFNGTIEAGGIALADDKGVIPVVFGQLDKVITTDAITGFAADVDNYVTLSVGKIAVSCSTADAIVSNGVKTATVTGDVANALKLNMLGDAPTITIQGAITAAITCTSDKLVTLNLGGIAINEGAFGENSMPIATLTALKTINWSPSTATKAFHKQAFSADAVLPEKLVTLNTNTAVAYTKYEWDGVLNNDSKLFGIKFVATAPTPVAVTTKIEFKGEVAPDGYYYATVFIDNSKKCWIQKVDGLTIYSVYLDGVDIYNNPLRVIGGKYYINGANAIKAGLIVKSKTNDDVTITYDDGITQQSIQNAAYASTTDPCDGLLYNASGVAISGAKIVMENTPFTLVNGTTVNYSDLADPHDAIVRVSDPATTKYVRYADFEPTSAPTKAIAKDGFFLLAKKVPAGAPRQVIWLDDMGNTTAIETVEAVAEKVNNNVIYNIAGQKVSADYKGLVIKNGKKFVQK